MFLSIPALKEVVIDAISKKTSLPRESVKQVLESDGPWTDHDRFLTNTFMSAKQRAEDLGVDLAQVEAGYPVDLEVSAEGGASFESAERLEEVSKETGQPLETIEAINQAYFEFIDKITEMMKKRLGGSETP